MKRAGSDGRRRRHRRCASRRDVNAWRHGGGGGRCSVSPGELILSVICYLPATAHTAFLFLRRCHAALPSQQPCRCRRACCRTWREELRYRGAQALFASLCRSWRFSDLYLDGPVVGAAWRWKRLVWTGSCLLMFLCSTLLLLPL